MKYLLVQFADTEDMSVYVKGAGVSVTANASGKGTVFATVDAVNPPVQALIPHTHEVAAVGPAQVTGVSGPPITS